MLPALDEDQVRGGRRACEQRQAFVQLAAAGLDACQSARGGHDDLGAADLAQGARYKVVLTRNERLLQALRTEAKAEDVPAVPGRRPWTDDYNNLFEVLK